MWKLGCGWFVIACEKHRNEMTPVAFLGFEMLAPGKAGCEFVKGMGGAA
jgi:hypothetical protein